MSTSTALLEGIEDVLQILASDRTVGQWAAEFAVSPTTIRETCSRLGVTCRPDDAPGAWRAEPARQAPVGVRDAIEAACPGWTVTHDTAALIFRARSPAYLVNGLVIEGANADEIIARIRRIR